MIWYFIQPFVSNVEDWLFISAKTDQPYQMCYLYVCFLIGKFITLTRPTCLHLLQNFTVIYLNISFITSKCYLPATDVFILFQIVVHSQLNFHSRFKILKLKLSIFRDILSSFQIRSFDLLSLKFFKIVGI